MVGSGFLLWRAEQESKNSEKEVCEDSRINKRFKQSKSLNPEPESVDGTNLFGCEVIPDCLLSMGRDSLKS